MLQFPIVKYKNEMLEMLAKLVAIPSVKGKPEPNMPYGKDVFKALLFMLDQAERLDLESVNLFGQMGYAAYGSGEETVGILTHLDVVPAGEGWDTDPFTLVEKDGRLYGRGTVDNKGAAVAALIALYALKVNCISLDKQVKVFFGCDEESGWADMDYYKSHFPEIDYVIAPDAFYPIINREKGLLHLLVKRPAKPLDTGLAILRITAGSRPNIVPNRAECLLHAPFDIMEKAVTLFNEDSPCQIEIHPEGTDAVLLVATGKAAHGCHPEEGINALAYLLGFLNTLPLSDGGMEQFVYTLNQLIGTDYTGRGLGLALEDELSGPLTVNLGAMECGDGEIRAKVDIRFPVSYKLAEIQQKAFDAFKAQGLEVSVLHAQDSHYVSEDSTLVRALKDVYQECFGEPGRCVSCSGATYARAFKNSVAFGPVPEDRPSVEHGPNEYIEMEDLLKLAEVLATAMVHLAGSPSTSDEIF